MIVVKQNCSCADLIEATYYSSTLTKCPPVAMLFLQHGRGQPIVDDVELKRQYGIVRPLCSTKGLTHKVSHPNNVTYSIRHYLFLTLLGINNAELNNCGQSSTA